MPLEKLNDKSNSDFLLNKYAKNVTSQFGEDGIIQKILCVIDRSDKWCVEFGASDGKYCSNTYNLIENYGYSAVLIESDVRKYKKLIETYNDHERVIALNVFVGIGTDVCLDTILKRINIPIDFDLLSIDIDGNDYHVLDAVKYYKPKVVIIEYNPTIPNNIEFVQVYDMNISQSSSLLSINKLAKSKGYELVAVTKTNAIYVDSRYFSLFAIRDNSIDKMRVDKSMVTYIFSGHDGTVFLRGCGQLPWHGIPYSPKKIQQIPKILRKHPSSYGIFRKALAKLYRSFHKTDSINRTV